jgi:hypothetical protein
MDHWAAIEFVGCDVPDPRFRSSLARNAEALASDIGSSFSVACGDDGRQAATRLFRHKGTTLKRLMKGHVQQTAVRCTGMPLVVVAQDTMILDYTDHHALDGLGPITSGNRSRGLIAHSALAISADGQPLGVLFADVWARKDRIVPKSAKRRKLAISNKESNKWLSGMRATARALPPNQQVLVVGDRESDIFDLFAARRRSSVNLLIRACHPRRVQPETCENEEARAITSLTQAIEAAPVAGEMVVDVPRKPGQSQRQARLTVQYCKVNLLPPLHGVRSKSAAAQHVTVIRVAELDPPKGVEPIVWILLTTMAVNDLDAASEMVHYYTLRWTIERLHFTLKSGCLNVERVQIDDVDALINALALYYIVAWRVLSLTYLARTKPDEPAASVLTNSEIEVLHTSARRPINTVADAMREIAILAGHPRWANTPPPGVKRICRGMLILLAMTVGWELATESKRYEPR